MASGTRGTPKKDWADAFFAAFERTHIVRSACEAVGVGKSTVYRRREDDEVFARRWVELEEDSTQILEQIAVRRAAEGSDVLLIFLLKSRRPERYRDHHRVEHTGPAGGRLGVEFRLDEGAREAIAGVLRQRPAAPPESSS